MCVFIFIYSLYIFIYIFYTYTYVCVYNKSSFLEICKECVQLSNKHLKVHKNLKTLHKKHTQMPVIM